MELTKEQKQELWTAGERCDYVEQILTEQADEFVEDKYPDNNVSDKVVARDIFKDGYLGRNDPSQEERNNHTILEDAKMLLSAIKSNIETMNVGNEFGKDIYEPIVKIQYINDEKANLIESIKNNH